MKRRAFLLSLGAAAVGSVWVGTRMLKVEDRFEEDFGFEESEAEGATVKPAGLTPQQIRPLQKLLAAVHQKKLPNQLGDWLDKHQEAGETFEQHLAAQRRRMCDRYATMYVVPLGEFTESQSTVVTQTTDFMGRFYGLPVKALPAVSLKDLPPHARRVHPTTQEPQILSTHLLTEVLERRRPKDAVALLGLTASDLWPGEGWNFVFGQASLTARVGVWSSKRNGDPEKSAADQALFLSRTLKTAVHETGHMLGFPHCIAYECGMNGSNHLAESDRQPIEFCPECVAKLWWTCGADPKRRLASLIEFGESHLKNELKVWQASLERLN